MANSSGSNKARNGCLGCLGLLVVLAILSQLGNPKPEPRAGSSTGVPQDSAEVAARALEKNRAESLYQALTPAQLRRLPDSLLDVVERHTYAATDTSDRKAVQAEHLKRKAAARANSIYEQARGSETSTGSRCRSVSRQRVATLVQRHGDWDDADIASIACGFVRIGMLAEQARTAWGRPGDINRSVYATGVHEQWVYSDSDGISHSYLYLEDGIVTSMQN